MKLYEFSYTDNLHQTEAQVLARVAELLDLEGDQQGWAPGYKFRQCRTLEQLAGGELRYHFEVLGSFAAGEGEDVDGAVGPNDAAGLPRGVAAASNGETTVER